MTMPYIHNTIVCFDIDDTLYKERDFVLSAYNEVSAYLSARIGIRNESLYKLMLEAIEQGLPPLQYVEKNIKREIPLDDCLNLYRHHVPNISLDEQTRIVLQTLRERGYVLGLITDGRSITQRNKIAALGLGDYVDDTDIIISEEIGSEKPSERNYRPFMEKYTQGRYVYVADNIEKDFIAPNRLGWTTICLLDNGKNIHRQDFKRIKDEAQRPLHVVSNITMLLQMI